MSNSVTELDLKLMITLINIKWSHIPPIYSSVKVAAVRANIAWSGSLSGTLRQEQLFRPGYELKNAFICHT